MRIPPPPLRPTPTSRPSKHQQAGPKQTPQRKHAHVVGSGTGLVRRGGGGPGGEVEEALRELAEERMLLRRDRDRDREEHVVVVGGGGEVGRERATLDLEGMCVGAKRIRGNNPAQTLDYVLIPAPPTTHVQEDFPPSSASAHTPPPHASGSPETGPEEDEDGWEMIGEDGEVVLELDHGGEESQEGKRREYAEVARG